MPLFSTSWRTLSRSPYQPVVPTTMFFAGVDAGLDIFQDSLRGGEVDHDIDIAQLLRRERGRIGFSAAPSTRT